MPARVTRRGWPQYLTSRNSWVGETRNALCGWRICSGPGLAKARAEGRELMGPAPASPDRGVYTAEAFQVNVEQRQAVCPTGKTSTQCARLVEGKTGAITYRFGWCGLCRNCAVKEACLHKGERDRVLRLMSITHLHRPVVNLCTLKNLKKICTTAMGLKARRANL